MNMTVVNKNNNEHYKVYDITYDRNGYPHFLIYKDGQWVRLSAKHFKPYNFADFTNDYEHMLKNYTYLEIK